MGNDASAEDGPSTSIEQYGLTRQKLSNLNASSAMYQHVSEIDHPVEPAGRTRVLYHRVQLCDECTLVVVAFGLLPVLAVAQVEHDAHEIGPQDVPRQGHDANDRSSGTV